MIKRPKCPDCGNEAAAEMGTSLKMCNFIGTQYGSMLAKSPLKASITYMCECGKMILKDVNLKYEYEEVDEHEGSD